MKKVFYSSWLAKKLLFDGYSTITLGPLVFTKYSKEMFRQSTMNHECTHARQWTELTLLSGAILWVLGVFVYDFSAAWLILSIFTFYVWYVIEYFIKWTYGQICADCKYNAYREISFEREARLSEEDYCYLENSNYFAWFKLIFKRKNG